jgi:hypothetical protein
MLNGWRVLVSAVSRHQSAPWIVLCEDPAGSARCFIVALVSSGGGDLQHAYHVSYESALKDFRVRVAMYAPTTH